MRFRLRSLLIFVTLCGIVAAIVLAVANHHEKLKQYRTEFDQIGNQVAAMDDELEQQLIQHPVVNPQLAASNPIDPPMAVSHMISGESMSYERYRFSREFHYDWQLADGTRADGVDISISALIDEQSFGPHVIRLTYVPDEVTRDLAAWIESELRRNNNVEIRHVKLTKEADDRSPDQPSDG